MKSECDFFICLFLGARNQPLVQLQRKTLQLPSNSNYTSLSAALTTARSQYEIGGFPFLLGQETNSSGWRLKYSTSTHFKRQFKLSGWFIKPYNADMMKLTFFWSGAEIGWTELTPLAVVSVQLFDKDGGDIQVSDPIHVSVPLPSDTRNRMATSVPAWLYQPKTGK